jgi:hypothetical protein
VSVCLSLSVCLITSLFGRLTVFVLPVCATISTHLWRCAADTAVAASCSFHLKYGRRCGPKCWSGSFQSGNLWAESTLELLSVD